MITFLNIVSTTEQKNCTKCKKKIPETDLYKIIIYVVDQKFTDHYYEHVECPDRFTI